MTRYILRDRKPVLEPDLLKWGLAFEQGDRVVGKATVGDSDISTVFLGLDHNFTQGPPLLFETMVFGGPLDGEQDRCSTWDEAERMHARMLDKVIHARVAGKIRKADAIAARDAHEQSKS